MFKTKRNNSLCISQRITVNTETLAEYLDCGRATAVRIGNSAGARLKIGSRVLWRVDLIENYLNNHLSDSK